MRARITLAEIEAARPTRIHDLFASRGVRLVNAGIPADVSSIHFAEPCRWRWDADGDLVVEQP